VRVLLDECIDWRLSRSIVGHDVILALHLYSACRFRRAQASFARDRPPRRSRSSFLVPTEAQSPKKVGQGLGVGADGKSFDHVDIVDSSS